MTLCQLIYVSRATEKLSLRDTMAIVDTARERNRAEDITGLL